MNDNIDKNEIRRAIDRLQIEHPCGIAYDPATFVNMEAVNTIKDYVDKIARRMMEDTEINIICEFAKLYLAGVRPTVERPHGEWLSYYDYCKKHEYLPTGLIAFWWCNQCEQAVEIATNFCPNCGADMRKKEDKPHGS